MTRTFLSLTLILAFAVTLFGNASTLLALDGKALYNSKGCAACHGPDGSKPLMPGYPKTKGQDETYILNQIKAFKSEERKGANSAVMTPMAKTLSDAEAAAIAKYLSSEK